MYNSDDEIINFSLWLFVIAIAFVIFLAIYDGTELESYSYQATLIDKWHESGGCQVVTGDGAVSCDEDTYGVVVKANNGQIFEDNIRRPKWQTIHVGSKILYRFKQGRLGYHHDIQISNATG